MCSVQLNHTYYTGSVVDGSSECIQFTDVCCVKLKKNYICFWFCNVENG